MAQRPHAQSTPEAWGQTVPVLGLVTDRHSMAFDALHHAAEESQALTLLFAEGRFEANHVISAFLASLGEEATIIRLDKPYRDAVSGMRAINRALGFEPKDLSLADLDKILEMYLDFQKRHRRRTVLCVEQAHLQGMWLLEHVRTMVELETGGRYGLMVILSGQPELRGMMEKEPLRSVRRLAGEPIILAPFTAAETTEFLRQRVAAGSTADVSELFEFDAINRIHELSGGVPDLVGTLALKCLQIARQRRHGPVTDQLVIDVARLLWHRPAQPANDDGPQIADIGPQSGVRQVLKITGPGRAVRQLRLPQGRYLVGRAETADICLPSMHVSRRHALIVKNKKGISIMDLGSTNGTFVNGLRFAADQSLSVGDTVRIGDIRLELAIA